MEMKRVLLKLSGEALAGPKKTGFDEATVIGVAKQIHQIVSEGLQVGIVIGGGNFWRGRTSGAMERSKADQIGMLATIMNCIYVSDICTICRPFYRDLYAIYLWRIYQTVFQGQRRGELCTGQGSIFCRWYRSSLFFYRYSDCASCSGDQRRCYPSCKSSGWYL